VTLWTTILVASAVVLGTKLLGYPRAGKYRCAPKNSAD